MNPEKLPPKIRYIRGIIRKRLLDKGCYFNPDLALELLADAYCLGVSLETLEDTAKLMELKSWSDHRDALYDLIIEAEQKSDSDQS